MGGGGYSSVLVNYQALQLKYCSFNSPPQSFFSIKYRRYGLLLVSFIEPVALLGGNTAFPSPQVRSQKFTMGGGGGKAPSRRRLGVWKQSPQPLEAWGVGAEPPALENFAFFAKITSF